MKEREGKGRTKKNKEGTRRNKKERQEQKKEREGKGWIKNKRDKKGTRKNKREKKKIPENRETNFGTFSPSRSPPPYKGEGEGLGEKMKRPYAFRHPTAASLPPGFHIAVESCNSGRRMCSMKKRKRGSPSISVRASPGHRERLGGGR